MQVYAAFLRAINVGGTGKLTMSELRALCTDAGLADVQTYIQSGNLIFRSNLSEQKVQAALEGILAEKMGKPHGVLVRTREELKDVLDHVPFADAAPNLVYVTFLPEVPPKDALTQVRNENGEKLVLRKRELYTCYPQGAGQSKLKVPFALPGTARNTNTVTKMVALADALAAAGP